MQLASQVSHMSLCDSCMLEVIDDSFDNSIVEWFIEMLSRVWDNN